jgi:hypothetical protein
MLTRSRKRKDLEDAVKEPAPSSTAAGASRSREELATPPPPPKKAKRPKKDAPPGLLAAGLNECLDLLSEFAADDQSKFSAQATIHRRVTDDLSSTPLVAIGSRALQTRLVQAGTSLPPDLLSDPNAPRFAEAPSHQAPAEVAGVDFDIICSAFQCAKLLRLWSSQGRLFDSLVKKKTKVVALVLAMQGNTISANRVFPVDIELLRPSSEWNVPDRPSHVVASSVLIVDDAVPIRNAMDADDDAAAAISTPALVDCSEIGLSAVPVYAPRIEVLFAIKRAHIFYPIQWRKHIRTLHFLLEKFPDRMKWDVGSVRDDPCRQVFLSREEETEGIFGGKPGQHVNLNVTNEQFFSQESGSMVIERQYDHDAIHERLAYPDRPLYESFKKVCFLFLFFFFFPFELALSRF